MLSGQLGFKETRNLKINLSRNETFATFRTIYYSSASGPYQVQCLQGSRETFDNNEYFSATPGFEFGDNKDTVAKTEDNGVAEVSFKVLNQIFASLTNVIIYVGFEATHCVSMALSRMVQMA